MRNGNLIAVNVRNKDFLITNMELENVVNVNSICVLFAWELIDHLSMI